MNNQQLVAKILEIFKDSSLNDEQKSKILLELLEEKDNVDVNNNSINLLKQFILDSIKTQNIHLKSPVFVNDLYGIFTDDNKFRIAQERSNWIHEKILICMLDYEVIQANDYSNPWTTGEMFYLSDTNAYAFPIKKLLSPCHIKNEFTTEAILLSLIETVNKYLAENPTFIKTIFEENTKKLKYEK